MVRRKPLLYHETSPRLLNCEVMVGMAVARIVVSRATRKVVSTKERKMRTSLSPRGRVDSSLSSGCGSSRFSCEGDGDVSLFDFRFNMLNIVALD